MSDTLRRKTPYSTDSLAALVLNPSDVNSALSAVGSDKVTDSADVNTSVTSSGSGVEADRTFKSNNGIIIVALFANADGSGLNDSQRNNTLSGQILSTYAQGVFDNVSGFTLGGSAGIGDADQLAVFSGSIQGVSLNVVGASFIKGNIYGIVIYATPGDADGVTLGALAGTQVNKLP